MSIGKKLKERRRELKLSVADVARRVGMAPSTMYDLERGDQHSSAKLAALCAFYELNPDWVEFNKGPRLTRQVVGAGKRGSTEQGATVLHGMQITAEEVEFGIEWGKLSEPARTLLRQQVYLLVAQQKRAERRSRRGHDGDPADERKGS